MSLYLPDSTALIDYERRKPHTRARLTALANQGHILGVCAITVAEFYSGRQRGADIAIDQFMDSMPYWEILPVDAIQAGRYRWDFAGRGIQLSTTDTLIAALAARLGATVLTENRKDFPMDDVQTVSLLA